MVDFDSSIDSITDETILMLKNGKCGSHWWGNFSKFSPCYKFSNEYMSSYMKLFDLKDKNVLTVCGSGDQLLSAIFKGASSVDVFDSNLLTYFGMWLKIYAIKYLSFNEFIDLYLDFNYKRNDIFDKLVKHFDDDNGFFWSKLFSLDDEIFRYFFRDSQDIFACMGLIPYLSHADYNLLQQQLNDSYFSYKDGVVGGCNINFNCLDVFDVINLYKNVKYDFINFSNIFLYIDHEFKFSDLCCNIISNNLNFNGSFILDYNWNKSYGEHFLKYKLGASRMALDKYCYDRWIYHDSIIVYTKK